MRLLLALPPHGTTIDVAPDDLVNNDLIIGGRFSYTSRSFTEVVEHLNNGGVHPSFLTTRRFTLEQAASAIAALRGVEATQRAAR